MNALGWALVAWVVASIPLGLFIARCIAGLKKEGRK